jgi:hypothetical protein
MYAEPRATKDLDLWIGMDIKNAEKVIKALEKFSGAPVETTAQRLASPGSFIVFGREPQRVDILADIDGCDFEECYTRRVRTSRQGFTISVISLEDLIVNKKKAGRPQDLVDVKKLEKFQKEKKKKK